MADGKALKILLVKIILLHIVMAQTFENVKHLHQELFKAYDADIRPINVQSNPIIVRMYLDLLSIGDLNEVSGRFTVQLIISLIWNDYNLSWDPSTYGNATSIVVPQTKIWRPQLINANPSGDFKTLGDDRFGVTISYTGTVVLLTGSDFSVSCPSDMTEFPVDTQMCSVLITAASYNANALRFDLKSPRVELNLFVGHAEWALVNATMLNYEEESRSIVEVRFKLKRKPLFYILTIICPAAGLSLLTSIVYRLPVESGERVSFSITIFLSFAVFATLIGDIIPPSSDPMSSLNIFIMGLQGLSGVTVSLTVYVTNIYFRNDDVHIPGYYRKLVSCYKKNFFSCNGRNCNPLKRNRNCTVPDNKGNGPKNVDVLTDKESSNNSSDQITWKNVGETLDSILYITMWVATLIINITCFYFLFNIN